MSTTYDTEIKEITVQVQGGVCEPLVVPEGVMVRIVDYDVDNMTVEERNDLDQDPRGERCVIGEWTGPIPEPKPQPLNIDFLVTVHAAMGDIKCGCGFSCLGTCTHAELEELASQIADGSIKPREEGAHQSESRWCSDCGNDHRGDCPVGEYCSGCGAHDGEEEHEEECPVAHLSETLPSIFEPCRNGNHADCIAVDEAGHQRCECAHHKKHRMTIEMPSQAIILPTHYTDGQCKAHGDYDCREAECSS